MIIDNISKICFGCEPLGGVDWGEVDVKSISSAICRALDLGVNFFDTAAVYGLGLSETRLSKILGNRRHDVCIATKGGLVWHGDGKSTSRALIFRDSSTSSLRKGVEDSLRRLKISRIPLYYIHWPDPKVEIRASFEVLNQLKLEGKIHKIGCSNFNLTQLSSASEVADISFAQLPLNLLENKISDDINSFLHSKEIKIVAYNVLANGLLTGKYNESSFFQSNDRRSRSSLFQGECFRQALIKVKEVNELAISLGLSCAQYSIAEILRRPNVASVIIGIKNTKQIEENWSTLQKAYITT